MPAMAPRADLMANVRTWAHVALMQLAQATSLSATRSLEVNSLHTSGITPAMEHSSEGQAIALMSAHAALNGMVVTSAKSCPPKYAYLSPVPTVEMELFVA